MMYKGFLRHFCDYILLSHLKETLDRSDISRGGPVNFYHRKHWNLVLIRTQKKP